MKNAFLVSVLALSLSGCATMFNSRNATLSAGANVAGAEVWVDGQRVGTAPMQVRLDAGKSHTIVFRAPGYHDSVCQVGTKVGVGWIVLDLLAGPLALIVDLATGSWNTLDTESCQVVLSPSGPVVSAEPASEPPMR